jgi:hypothetical protein
MRLPFFEGGGTRRGVEIRQWKGTKEGGLSCDRRKFQCIYAPILELDNQKEVFTPNLRDDSRRTLDPHNPRRDADAERSSTLCGHGLLFE